VGETFGNLDTWDAMMFDFPKIPGARKALGTYSIPDDSPILDLDHAYALHERGMRPTSVVQRIRAATQTWALRIFEEPDTNGDPLWDGVEWWSFQRPHWRVLGLWGPNPPAIVDVDDLSLTHKAVIDAAASLNRVI